MDKVLLIITTVSWLFSQSELSYDFGVNIRIHLTETNQKFPDMIFDSNNTMHLVWVEQVGSGNNIFYSRSDESGLSFQIRYRSIFILTALLHTCSPAPGSEPGEMNYLLCIWMTGQVLHPFI